MESATVMVGLAVLVTASLLIEGACTPMLPKALVIDPLGSHVQTRPIVGDDARLRFTFTPLRTVEFDGFALPLLSPDGCRGAIQISSAADWPTLLAAVDGGLPDAGQIAIAPLCDASGAPVVEVVGTDLLIGRSADAFGFLIESPRIDGARWIGKVGWTGGDPEWLVRGEEVNAFASLGSGGELAWCHRPRHADGFSLTVKRGDDLHEIPSPEGGSWFAPTFSTDGKFLFALRLRDGVLAACAFPIAQTISTLPMISIDLSWRADARMAYQTLVPLRTGGNSTDPRLHFYHPRFGRMAVWNPVNNRIALATPRSAASVSISGDRCVTASLEGLAVEPAPIEGSATERKRRTSIVDSMWVPVGRSGDDQVIAVLPRTHSLDVSRIDLAPLSK
ncbi:MAG: hypothetical protein EXS15_03375 [Phycisphaerales bacterium]|nr:hypothetical protein [Phycisphaerales bacterium]